MIRYKPYLEFIRYSLNLKDELPKDVAKIDWEGFFQFAEEQGILGVVFVGIQQLGEHGVKPPFEVLMQWIASSTQIERQNKAVNNAAVALFEELKNDGFWGCILKGQGNNLMYPNVYSRTPGDIDVWLLQKSDGRGLMADGIRMKEDVRGIIKYVKERNPKGKVCYHHIDYGTYEGVEVEVHYRPSFMFNPVHNSRLQRWFRKMADGGCLMAELPENAGSIRIPTREFNIIFQLSHIYNHLLHEGIGLRQIIDYYYVLKSNTNRTNNTNSIDLLHYLGLTKIAGALMWVLHEKLGLEEEYLVAPKDEKRGKVLLNEILRGGNFGHYDTANRQATTPFKKNIQRLKRDFRMVCYFPSECLWEPAFRVYHYFWRQWQKYT